MKNNSFDTPENNKGIDKNKQNFNRKPFDAMKCAQYAWDFSIFDGCFQNPKIRPTDIDFMIERKGKFLFIDFKSPNKPLPNGQLISYRSLSELPNVSVLIVYGITDCPEKIQAIVKGQEGEIIDCNLECLRLIVWHFDRTQEMKLPR